MTARRSTRWPRVDVGRRSLRGIVVVLDRACVVLCGSVYLLLGHQPRRPPRLPRRRWPALFGWIDADGHRCGWALRHRPRRARTRPGAAGAPCDHTDAWRCDLGQPTRTIGRRRRSATRPPRPSRVQRLAAARADDDPRARPGGAPPSDDILQNQAKVFNGRRLPHDRACSTRAASRYPTIGAVRLLRRSGTSPTTPSSQVQPRHQAGHRAGRRPRRRRRSTRTPAARATS